MSLISLSIVLYGPCGLQQVQPVSPCGPPRFALAVAPPPFPPYLFITLLPTRSTPQLRTIGPRSSFTASPSDTVLPARHSTFPARVFRDLSMRIGWPYTFAP
ncbi:hypothetical protein C8F04DRAFT_1250332 [Mycena alexandri]|uniref:Uncharacterized protein n=1 Tax=Mycena alexandri TaxID=1745969 RepID=A0AAD6XGG2_9AGAR|nr:hypothetical protein C8F04DRAFT_1250332 [Mycena alexandri]